MTTLRQLIDGNSIHAFGTTEGAKRGWDSRGRKSEEKTTERNREIARFQPNQLSIFGPQHVAELQKLHRDRIKKLKGGMLERNEEADVERGSDGSGH